MSLRLVPILSSRKLIVPVLIFKFLISFQFSLVHSEIYGSRFAYVWSIFSAPELLKTFHLGTWPLFSNHLWMNHCLLIPGKIPIRLKEPERNSGLFSRPYMDLVSSSKLPGPGKDIG